MVNVCAENQGIPGTQEPLSGSTLKSGSISPECLSVDMYKDMYMSAGVAGRCLCLWHGVPDTGLQGCVCARARVCVPFYVCTPECGLAHVCIFMPTGTCVCLARA